MRELLRRTFVNSLSIFIVSLFLSGLVIRGGFASYVVAGFLLAVLSIFLDPIVKLFTMPFNILTLGLLSFLTTLVSLFILNFIYHNISITSFTFNGVSFLGLKASHIYVGGILSYVVISATIYFCAKLINFAFSNQ